MDLNHLNVEARTRTPWEAIDLGFVMTRQWWRASFLSWFIPSASLFVVLSILFHDRPSVALLVVWWLKPLWDRGPLYIASRDLFGESVTLRETLLKLPSLYKTDWFIWLTWRRFSATRSFDMPLTLLEKVRGKQRSSRQSLLHRRHSGAASWLTIVCIHLEYIFMIGTTALMVAMVPATIEIDLFNIILEENVMVDWLSNILLFLGMALVAPFYSISGFALYISRRIDLEAWDIEIRFRHLAESLNKKRSFSSVLLGLALCSVLFIGGTTLVSEPALAADTTLIELQLDPVVSSPESQKAKENIIQVLEGDEFHQIEFVEGWRLKQVDQLDVPEWFISLIEFILKFSNTYEGIGNFFAAIAPYLEFILWGSMLTIILFVLYKYRKAIKNYAAQSSASSELVTSPELMFGLDLRKESLPENIPKAVQELWQMENYRAATSLLYRAMLSGLIHQYNFIFLDSHTEGECARIVQKRGIQNLSRYSLQLTQCWQQIAYGHVLPKSSQIESLCKDWDEIFPSESHPHE